MDNILAIIKNSPQELMLQMAHKVKELRLFYGYKRKTLAEKSGVTEASLKRFEMTGQISFESLIKLAFALEASQEFLNLFPLPLAHSIKELQKQNQVKKRKRGRL